MKKFLTQKINFAYAVIVALVMTAGISGVAAQYALPGQINDLSPLIHRGGGDQAIEGSPFYSTEDCPHGVVSTSNPNYSSSAYYRDCVVKRALRLGSDGGLAVNFDARGPAGAISWFDTASDSVFATLQNSFFLGKLVIGATATPIWNTIQSGQTFISAGGPFTVPIQKVNVIGNTLATNLQNPQGDRRVCVDNSGTLVLCEEVTYYQYQCDYTTGSGQWGQPTYSAEDGTDIGGGGTIQGGVAEFDTCPVNTNYGPLSEYRSTGSYTSGDNVCATSLPNNINCTAATVPAFVCGGLTSGEWNSTGYGAMNCPYQNYSSASTYAQGDTVCSPLGAIPDNGTCTAPTVPAFVCQPTGEWSPSGYGAPTCPYSNYSGSVQYSNGDLVCNSSGAPSNTNCTASSNGQCGPSNNGTFSSTPSTGLCSSGTASVVATNTSTSGSTSGSCVGTYNTYGSNVSLNIDLISNTGSTGSFRDQLYSISGTPEAGQVITWTVYSYSNTYTVQSGDTIDSIGSQIASITNNTTSAQWRSANPASYGSWTQGNPVGFEPTGTYNSSTNRLNLRLNWQNQFAMSLQKVEQCSGATTSSSCTAQSSSCNWVTSSVTTTTYDWNCSGSDGGTNESCSALYEPATVNGQCSNFSGTYSSQPANAGNACISGSYSDTSDTSNQWRWSCVGVNGGSSSSCDANRVSYSWNIGPWGACIGGNETRSVTCQNNSGTTVSNSLCSSPAPSTTRSCGGGLTIDDGTGGSCNPIFECCQPDGSGNYIPGPPCA